MENRLYFGNIPFDKTEDDVQNLFQECGEIAELKIIRREHVSQGYGFITFKTKEAIDNALKKNGQEVGGRSMKVNYAAKREPNATGAAADTNRLFVKNLPPETTEDSIKEAFATHGVVTAVKFIKDHNTGASRGFAFVDFETHQQAQSALNMNDSKALGQTPLVVKIARDKKQQIFWQGGPQRGFAPYNFNQGQMGYFNPGGQQFGGYNQRWQQQYQYGGYNQNYGYGNATGGFQSGGQQQQQNQRW